MFNLRWCQATGDWGGMGQNCSECYNPRMLWLSSHKQSFSILIILVVILAFLSAGVFALPAMAFTDHAGMGERCPFMVGETALCQTNILAHISSWQTYFVSLSPSSLFLLLLLASSLLLALIFTSPNLSPPRNFRIGFKFLLNPRGFRRLYLFSAISPRAP